MSTKSLSDIIDQCTAAGHYHALLGLFIANGIPMSIEDHFQMCPMFTCSIPACTTYQCSRQVGKTYGLTAQTIIRASAHPYFNTLTIQPRDDQLQRYNQTIYEPMLDGCLLADAIMARAQRHKLRAKRFRNGSISFLEYAFVSPDRVRGISGVCQLNVDEAQDIDYDFIPVLRETMTAQKKWGIIQFTGTPLTTDTSLTVSFEDSSKAEWVIPCSHCKKLNVPSIRHDLIRMIGKTTCICAKCRKPLDVRTGHYEHEIPERRASFPGYHIGQVTHPVHTETERKWYDLLDKMNKYSTARFHNEVLGEAFDENVRLLAVEDLVRASNGMDNTLKAALHKRTAYPTVAMGIDWSGGGDLSYSFTVFTVVGTRPGTEILDCIYAERLRVGMQPEEESAYLMEMIGRFLPQIVAHDYGGAGYVRESIMRQAGLPLGKIMPFTYVASSGKNIIVRNPATAGSRSSFSLDKARSLALMVSAIRAGKLSLPDYAKSSAKGNILDDLLNLMEVPKETARGDIAYFISHKPKKPDDFSSALNYASSALWFMRGAYPKLDSVDRYAIRPDQLPDPFPEKKTLPRPGART